MISVLLIDDDKTLTEYLSEYLMQENCSVKVLHAGTQAVKTAETILPDIVILDLGLPDLKGETVCKDLKESNPELPVIILTGKDDVSDKVKAFDIGADDYITKPFEKEELMSRIKARVREVSHEKVLIIEDLAVDLDSMQVTRNSKTIDLTPHEYKILVYLMQNKNRVLSREALLNKIWPNAFDIETRVVDVYISYLRKKIDKGHKRKLIHSKRGFGYLIKD